MKYIFLFIAKYCFLMLTCMKKEKHEKLSKFPTVIRRKAVLH